MEEIKIYEGIKKLKRYAKILHKIFENNCNGLYSEEEYNKLYSFYEKKIKRICDELGLYYYIQTDPRGSSLRISKNEINGRNYLSGEPL